MAGKTKEIDERYTRYNSTMHPDLLQEAKKRAEELGETLSLFIAKSVELRLGLAPQTLTQTDLAAIEEMVLRAVQKDK